MVHIQYTNSGSSNVKKFSFAAIRAFTLATAGLRHGIRSAAATRGRQPVEPARPCCMCDRSHPTRPHRGGPDLGTGTLGTKSICSFSELPAVLGSETREQP